MSYSKFAATALGIKVNELPMIPQSVRPDLSPTAFYTPHPGISRLRKINRYGDGQGEPLTSWPFSRIEP